MAESKAVAEALGNVLADTFALYLKTHVYHWNVRGPEFPELHRLFNKQYDEIWEAVDVIAEQIRALGELTPAEMLTSAISIPDPSSNAAAMVADLLAGHEAVAECVNAALKVAEAPDDQGTINILADRLNAHQKHAWMLRATLGRV